MDLERGVFYWAGWVTDAAAAGGDCAATRIKSTSSAAAAAAAAAAADTNPPPSWEPCRAPRHQTQSLIRLYDVGAA